MIFGRKKDNLEEVMGKELDQAELTVKESYERDKGRGIARIDPAIMKKMMLSSGDVIEIHGKKRIPAIVWPGYPEDEGKNIIRIDGSLRNNLEVRLGEKVVIKPCNSNPAEEVVIAPTEPVRVRGGEAYLLRLLEGRSIIKGQKIRVEIFGHTLTFVIVKTTPDGVVVVNRDTTITLLDRPYEEPEEILKKNPKALFKEWIGKNVLIYLKGDNSITGILKGFDEEYNFLLEKATLFSGNVKLRDFEVTVVNGANVLNVSLAKTEEEIERVHKENVLLDGKKIP